MHPIRVLVTGAGRGIGRAIALRFAREGAFVGLAARTEPELEGVLADVERVGGSGVVLPLDVTDLASVENAVHRLLEATGGLLDVVVNNAGAFTIVPFAEMSPATWYRLLAVNLNGPFHVTLLTQKALLGSDRAHLFNIASVAGQRPFEGSSAYCTSKYGLRGLSDVLRLELPGVRVSTVYPSATDTSIFDDVPGEWDRSTMNTPDEVAEVVWQAWSSPRDTDVSDLEIPNPRVSG